MNIEQIAEEYAVKRVRQVWAFARDHGEWETMRGCFHPEATVRVLWFSGPATTFFARTIEAAKERAPEEGSKHWFGNSRAWVKGDPLMVGAGLSARAVAKTPPPRKVTSTCSTWASAAGRRISQWAPLPTWTRSESTTSCSVLPSG